MNYRTFDEYVADLDEFGDHLALTTRSFLKIERLTHRQLQTRVYQTAHFLSAQGVVRGDRVMVVAANSPQWVELLLGTLLLGAVLVPVDVSSSPQTTLRFVKETEPTIVFLNQFQRVGLDASVRTFRLEEVDGLIAGHPGSAPGDDLHPDWPALIVFTSGTTADPKGVVLTQGNVLANISGIQERIAIDAEWRLLSVLPLSHTYELTASLAVLSRGASIFYLPRVTPLAISRALVDYEITMMLAIPQLLALMLERIQQSAAAEGKARILAVTTRIAGHLPFPVRRMLLHSVHSRLGGHLDLVITGGAPIPIEVATTWERMGVRMVQGYGLTETSPILTCNDLTERRLDSPGRALDNVELRIGEDGEIQAKGPSVFSEYWHNEAATHEAFTDDGWFRTGDVGRLDDGWLRIQGRLKFAVVRSSGLKVFPEDIELVAHGDPRLREFCVVGAEGPQGETVMALVISDDSDEAVAGAIAELNSQLESYQHVDAWRRWPNADFPRTRLLKVDRRQVQLWTGSAADEGPLRSDTVAATGDPLLHVIRMSLNDANAAISESDRLGDVGLDSLRRLTVVSLLEEQLSVSISDEGVTSATTVAQLRQLVEHGSPVEEATRPPVWPYWRWVRLVGNGLRDGVLRAIVRVWVRTDVVGAEVLDDLETPAIFIFNHCDDFDGPVIYQALPRRIRERLAVAMADDVLRDHRALAVLARLCFAGFSFARSEPFMPSLEYVGEVIDRQWNVLIAPEGAISRTAELQEFKSGIGLLAVSLGVPVVTLKTVGLAGTLPLHAKWPKRRSRVTVRIGRPMRFGPEMNYEDVTDMLHRAMELL
ncbi:MAG TPA: AMP-binding protein [Acidimicrobiales bacterium]